MSDDDDFLKELQEATNDLEKEYNVKQNKQQNTNNTNKNNTNVNTNVDPQFNEKEMGENLNQLFKMFGGLTPEKMGFDDSDKENFKKFHEAFMNELKNEDLLKDIGLAEGLGDPNLGSNNQNKNLKDNPFTDTFNQMNNDKEKDFDMDNFEKEFGKIFESLNKLTNIKDDGGKMGEDGKVPNFLEGAIDSLISAKLLEPPLKEVRGQINTYLSEKQDMPDNKRKEYIEMLKNIDIVLIELEKPNPNKGLIIENFSKLQESSELDEELFNKISPDMSMFGVFKDLKGSPMMPNVQTNQSSQSNQNNQNTKDTSTGESIVHEDEIKSKNSNNKDEQKDINTQDKGI